MDSEFKGYLMSKTRSNTLSFEIGSAIRRAREEKNMTQEELARRTQMEVEELDLLESGQAHQLPPAPIARAIKLLRFKLKARGRAKEALRKVAQWKRPIQPNRGVSHRFVSSRRR